MGGTERFQPVDRIRRKSDFDAVFRRGRRHPTPLLSLIVLKREPGRKRLGLSVSGKAGGSVERNRIKRWAREVFRRNRDSFPEGADVVVVVTRPMPNATFDEFRSTMLKAAAKAR